MKILGESSTHNPIGYNLSKPRIFIKFDKRLLLLFDTRGNFFYIVTCAGVVKLVDARDSKSRGASTPCRFDSDLRHQLF